MKNFANDDSDRNFESGRSGAQTSEAKASGAADERPGETNADRDRADGTRCHAADAGDATAAASGSAEKTEATQEEKGRMTTHAIGDLRIQEQVHILINDKEFIMTVIDIIEV
jgi:hypothetical protein